MSIKSQCHSLTLTKSHTDLKIKNSLSQKLFGHSKPDFIRMGMKVNINELGQMTKMATMPMYGKNLLLQNLLTDALET